MQPITYLSVILFATHSRHCAFASQLPSVEASKHASHGAQVRRESKWWVRVGERVFFAPPSSMASLSQDVGDYYYAVGSTSGAPNSLADRRVGGDGRWHIFHIPEGPASFLQASTKELSMSVSGNRRASLSALKRLSHSKVLASEFPVYNLNGAYRHPLDEAGQTAEHAAVATLTPDGVMSILRDITTVPKNGDGTVSRSWEDADATQRATALLQDKFGAMGLKTCMQEFDVEGKTLANVIGHIPGRVADSVVVGAHYDSRPYGGLAPGAEDNGSGLASMLAVAQAFKQANVEPEKNLYFVGFAAEEPGLKGSAAFAHALHHSALPAECQPTNSQSFLQTGIMTAQPKRASHNTAIVLDEVGWVSPNLAKTTLNLESYDWTHDLLEDMAQASKTHNGDALEVVHSNNPFGSDHMSFLDLGTPAVLAINGDDEKYPNYHQSTDSIDNVNQEYMAWVSRMVLGATMRQAGVHVTPAMK